MFSIELASSIEVAGFSDDKLKDEFRVLGVMFDQPAEPELGGVGGFRIISAVVMSIFLQVAGEDLAASVGGAIRKVVAVIAVEQGRGDDE